jgi:hypothetical protein
MLDHFPLQHPCFATLSEPAKNMPAAINVTFYYAECTCRSLLFHTDSRLADRPGQRDLSTSVIEFLYPRTARCSVIINKPARTGQRESHLVAGVHAHHPMLIEQRWHQIRVVRSGRCFLQQKLHRLRPKFRLYVKPISSLKVLSSKRFGNHAQMVLSSLEVHQPSQSGARKVLAVAMLRAHRSSIAKKFGHRTI